MPSTFRPIHLMGISFLVPAVVCAGVDWPEFRGPTGQGHASSSELPLRWSEERGVLWKTPIHGRGWSTPVVGDGRIWLTTATEDGRRLSVVCVSLADGKILHDRQVFEVSEPQPLGNPVNSYASPSPALSDGRVFVHFGSYGTACLETSTGKLLWTRRDLPCDHFRGPGSSVFLHGDSLILTFDGFDVQYIVSLDRATGRTSWKRDRSFPFGDIDGDLRKAYSTPILIDVAGKLQLVSCGSKAAYAYDPATGEEIWRVRYEGFSNASRPVHGSGLLFLNTGFSKADLWAVRPDGRGDVTDSHVVWKCTQGVPLKPSPVVVDDLIFMVNDGGIATCLEAKTGAMAWRERIGGEYSASPIHATGRVYFFSEAGKTTVVAASRSYSPLAENQLEGGFMASPATSGKALILRTKTHLYRIEE